MTLRRNHAGTGMATILSRLFLVVSLALFGAFQTGFDRVVPNSSPTAFGYSASLSVILTAQTSLLRAQLPDDDTPDYALAASSGPVPKDAVAFAVSQHQETPFVPVSLYILPPSRGPPAV